MASLMLVSCIKHDEISFSGTLVDVRICGSVFETTNAAYFVQLNKPDSVGGTYTSLSGNSYGNTVMLFDPGRRLYVGDQLSGTFYFDKGYGRANCGSWSDVDLPEGVFVNVSVD